MPVLALNLTLLVILLFCLIYTFFRFVEIFLPVLFCGGMYVPSKNERVKKMVELLEIKESEKAVDLGSGDGRIVIALAKAGALAYGYEINPFLAARSRKKIKELGLEKRAFILQKNFWNEDLSGFNIVTVYGIHHIMEKLGVKLSKELKPNARVAFNAFYPRSLKLLREEGGVYLYSK